MASSVIHMAVANEINKKLKRNNKLILLGSIAPDIAKLIGDARHVTHFTDEGVDYPYMDRFLDKYKNNLNDDFVLGYFIHLYTDYFWFKYFITELVDKDVITKKDGTKVKLSGHMLALYIYNDYTNLNIELIDDYELDLSIFYNELPKINDIIKEFNLDKIDVLIEKMGLIIKNSKETKEFVFDKKDIDKFISTSVSLILSEIEELGR